MKRYLVYGLIFSVVSVACGKTSDNNVSSPYFLNAYIQNVKYSTSSVSTFVLPNQQGCVSNKSYNITNIGQINVDAYYLDCYIKHYSNNLDFAPIKPGPHRIFDGGLLLSTSGCNGDLVIGLIDNSIPSLFSNTVLAPANVVNNITSITKRDSTATYVTYIVKGNFSCNFKNTNNVVIPVVGSYNIPLKEAK
ncbi:hypothetical protein SAMN05444410_11027 [Hydrobacter penzbergensis]|jgi:hypothetical protein|uniref:Lipoprotein n=1 Tax=Hydrobacter penzbergensis TaxID=1235997 RepID=A0A8X8IGY9_9BACT|nr:hypothetical protein [Hydrobacter penzbergensis]MBN8720873.1 hypothetical protein [Sediminibacterium magnilacihabitans]PQV58122.1 hypothetical protein CLV53_12227 [Sediminibacterium magnilacihabitans]SDX17015.1 hypothetical protein SAMN05444410_11027 [Hydrobacter penzbergensis]